MGEIQSCEALICAGEVETTVAAVFGLLVVYTEWESNRGNGIIAAGGEGAGGYGRWCKDEREEEGQERWEC